MSPELIIASNGVKRFHTVPTIQTQTVGQHVANMMGLLTCTGYNYSLHLVHAILWHDMAEVYTGDIPAPAKRRMHDIHKLEYQWEQANGINRPIITMTDEWMLQFLDYLEGAFFCQLEVKLGNSTIHDCYNRYKQALLDIMNEQAIREIPPPVRDKIVELCDRAVSL